MQIIKDISETTRQKRNQLASLQDEFTTFSWGGVEAFENFGAFIINEKKGSLKFYNGPGFSNEYTKPQFDNAGGLLQGVTFNKQTISFTIGVYWISIEHYRKLLNWLSPLKISYLQFGFAPKYRYDVKLSKLADSTRWVVGKENGEPRYYTELQLTFDVQGTPCAKGINSYEFTGEFNNKDSREWDFSSNNNMIEGSCYLYQSTDFIPSDLETPVQINFDLNLEADNLEANYFFDQTNLCMLGEFNSITSDAYGLNIKVAETNASFVDCGDSPSAEVNLAYLSLKEVVDDRESLYSIDLLAAYKRKRESWDVEEPEFEEIKLCSLTLQKLALFIKSGYKLHFSYFGETGLVFLRSGEATQGNLLTLQTFTDSGDFLVQNLQTYKFTLPGELNYEGFYSPDSRLKFMLRFSKKVKNNSTWVSKTVNLSAYKQAISIVCFPRTNII